MQTTKLLILNILKATSVAQTLTTEGQLMQTRQWAENSTVKIRWFFCSIHSIIGISTESGSNTDSLLSIATYFDHLILKNTPEMEILHIQKCQYWGSLLNIYSPTISIPCKCQKCVGFSMVLYIFIHSIFVICDKPAYRSQIVALWYQHAAVVGQQYNMG